MQQPLLQTLRWMRTFGDLVFILGALSMALQVVLGLLGRMPAPAAKVDVVSGFEALTGSRKQKVKPVIAEKSS